MLQKPGKGLQIHIRLFISFEKETLWFIAKPKISIGLNQILLKFGIKLSNLEVAGPQT